MKESVQASSRSVLLLGGTGAIGVYLGHALLSRGWEVFVTSRTCSGIREDVTYIRGNAKDLNFLSSLSVKTYDAIVDFMTWDPAVFQRVLRILQPITDQYVFLSSYRVFASTSVITESSPRLLDVCEDTAYVRSHEYAIAKALEENELKVSERNNWTIVRPAITYSKRRFQLGTLEAEEWLWRALRGIPVPMTQEILDRQCTLTWGGDVARLMASLIGNPLAIGEIFNVSTSKHQTWNSILNIYRKVLDFEIDLIPLERYERFACWNVRGIDYCPQLRYDRLFDRVLDNAKVLSIAHVEEAALLSADDGIPAELTSFLLHPDLKPSPFFQARLDRACSCGRRTWKKTFRSDESPWKEAARYLKGYLGA